jgi:excisionase family DNA binding protein
MRACGPRLGPPAGARRVRTGLPDRATFGTILPSMRTYTISEAAELTGLTKKAIARRVERGSIHSLVRNGRRRIPRSELLRAGLLLSEEDAETEEIDLEDFEPGRVLLPGLRSRREPAGVDATGALTALVRELVDRLERQAGEIASFRAISAHAESLRLVTDLAELRARISQLESQPRPKELTRTAGEPPAGEPARPTGEPGRVANEQKRRGAAHGEEPLWLPPGADSARAVRRTPAKTQAQLEHEAALAGRPSPLAETAERRMLRRSARLAAEVLFLVAVAAGVWLAELQLSVILGVMAFAWVVVAAAEWMSWRQEH